MRLRWVEERGGISIDGGPPLHASIAAAVVTARLLNASSEDVILDHLPERAFAEAVAAVRVGASEGVCVVRVTGAGVRRMDVRPDVRVRRHHLLF